MYIFSEIIASYESGFWLACERRLLNPTLAMLSTTTTPDGRVSAAEDRYNHWWVMHGRRMVLLC
jgi:hypothetical protein